MLSSPRSIGDDDKDEDDEMMMTTMMVVESHPRITTHPCTLTRIVHLETLVGGIVDQGIVHLEACAPTDDVATRQFWPCD